MPTLFSTPRPNWATQTVSLTVPRKYSTDITMLNTRSPCVITKATCVDCLHFTMSFYSCDKKKGPSHAVSSFCTDRNMQCAKQTLKLRTWQMKRLGQLGIDSVCTLQITSRNLSLMGIHKSVIDINQHL